MTVNFEDALNMFDPVSVSEAHPRALHLEKQFNRRSGNTNTIRNSGGGFANQPQARGIVPSSVPPRAAVGESGLRSQPNSTGAVTRSQNGITRSRCFTCGEPGHRAAECRQGGKYGKGLFVESEDIDDSDIPERDPIYDDNGDIQEELVEGDAGPLLVVRRTCFTPRDLSGDSWLRNNIFQSTCTINGKVCNMVIDPGSCENVISQEAVAKLNLPTEQHPQPYRLSWLKKGNVVTVTKRCLVQFSIGAKYKDKAWCDVVEMDACHLLLGRPWEFDTWATHDGRNNTYSFVFENNKIVLLPKKTSSANTTHNESASTSLFTRQQFVNAVEETRIVYGVNPRAPIDLAPVPDPKRVHGKAEDFMANLQHIHTTTQARLAESNDKYKGAADQKRRHLEFEVGDFVWAVLTKERFSVGEYNKLSARKIGPVEIVEKINSNAYRLKLPNHIRTADVFNVKHLIPFRGDNSDDDTDANSRPNFVSPGENDAFEVALRYLEAVDGKKGKKRF